MKFILKMIKNWYYGFRYVYRVGGRYTSIRHLKEIESSSVYNHKIINPCVDVEKYISEDPGEYQT